jgi:hemoglobin-like flavoprotein
MTPNGMMLTGEQRRLIRESFDPLRELAGPLSLLFYGKLFELDPSARRLFHNDLGAQGRKLMDTLGTITESLDHFDAVRAPLGQLGRRHAEFGVRPEQYETVTTALLWAIGQALGPDFDAPTREAWRLALTAVSAAMKGGTDLA